MEIPLLVKEDRNYIILYKPGNMHSAPLRQGEPGTLLDFCGQQYPEVLIPRGKKTLEGGLVHRLDFETEGLVLFARNQESLDHFLRQQDQGKFLKRYDALASKTGISLEGFPFPPEMGTPPFEIKSAFRPYAQGRKAVRPVLMDFIPRHKDVAFDDGGPYVTKILEWESTMDHMINVKAQLSRGFRHQIRCHLAWLGFPIVNDHLYGGQEIPGFGLALKAVSLCFNDPETGQPLEVAVPEIHS